MILLSGVTTMAKYVCH